LFFFRIVKPLLLAISPQFLFSCLPTGRYVYSLGVFSRVTSPSFFKRSLFMHLDLPPPNNPNSQMGRSPLPITFLLVLLALFLPLSWIFQTRPVRELRLPFTSLFPTDLLAWAHPFRMSSLSCVARFIKSLPFC